MSFLPGMFPAAAAAASRLPLGVVNTATNAETTFGATNHTATLPSSIQAGNLLLLIVGAYNNTTINTPAGWTQLFHGGSLSFQRTAVFYKIATGSEGASVAFTTSSGTITAHNSYQIVGFQGTPQATNAQAENQTPDPPLLTPSWGSALTLWIAAFGANIDGGPGSSTAPSGYGSFITAMGTHEGFNFEQCASAYKLATASSDNPGTFGNMSSGDPIWVATTIAIRSA